MPPSLRPEHILNALLSSQEDGLFSYSLDGTIQSWSSGAERLFGYTAAEIVGQRLTVLVPIYEVPACEEFLRAAKNGNFACCGETERLRKDGSRVRVTLKRAAVRDEHGQVAGMVETVRSDGFHSVTPQANGALHSLMEQMPAILWTTDQHLKITSTWGAGFDAPHLKSRNFVGRTLLRLFEMS